MMLAAQTLERRAPHQRRMLPLKRMRPALQRLRADLTRTLAKFLHAQAPLLAAQVGKLRAKVGKAAATAEEKAAIDAILAQIDFTGWAVLVGDVEGAIEGVIKDSAYAALAQVGIDVEARPEIRRIVDERAVAYARERGAEMVGMRVDELGRLVQNPNAFWRITEPTRDYMRADVTTAIVEGWSNDRLATALAEAYGFSPQRAMVIARTETNRAASIGALSGYKASGVVAAKQWLTAEDDLVSEECIENGAAGPGGDGVLPLNAEYPSGDEAPPVHPNAVFAGTTFAPYGDLLEMVSADYSGPAILIHTAQGKTLPIGPNHPILTGRGMVRARELRKGDDLVYDLRADDAAIFDAQPNFEQMPFVEDAFQTVAFACGLSRIPGTAHDLHGDRAFCQGEVEIVKPARRLLPVLDSCGVEQLRESELVGADMESVAPSRQGARGFAFDAVDLPTPGGVRGSLPNSHFQYLRIQSIHYAEWEGKAFDASTTTGVYNSHGFVVSNCRCAIAPVVEFTNASGPAVGNDEE